MSVTTKKRIEITKGQVLVIKGKGGSAKTTLARSIAESYGSFKTTNMKDLLGGGLRFELGALLRDQPKTIIVEEFTSLGTEFERARQLSTNDKITVEIKHENPRVETLPNFIFVVQSLYNPAILLNPKKFRVLDTANMGGQS